METEFIYYRHITPPGIKIEEITGYEQKSGKIWRELAKQVYCENGQDGFRLIRHLDSGAPFLEDEPYRISISHTDHILVVASLPKTPKSDLSVFDPRTAMGVDVESLSRDQVLSIRERFLSDLELAMIDANDTNTNILAWTAKEAIYKAMLTPGLDFRNQISINRLPSIANKEIGIATVKTSDSDRPIEFHLFSYESEGYAITIAYSPKCATFKKHK